jgi:uncharacterized damage-inducible protein DinB
MTIAETLLLDYDAEIENTRRILERIPEENPQWKPHDRSMPMGRLAVHVAQLPLFGSTILTTDELDMATAKFPPLIFEGREKLLAQLEETSAVTRNTLENSSDEHLLKRWKLRFGDQIFGDAPRAVLYRSMFLNHLVHHRGQLSVYLRLNEVRVPGLYGPSADEQFPT